MENIDFPIPFRNIALSLSGGGYRATTFHLGAISLLNALEFGPQTLLQRVSILSTISGGTLTGVMYALKLAQGKGYQGCFDKIYVLLEEDRLVEQALHKLNNPKNWTNPHKSRDVINAFSEVYNEHFYDQATFAELYDNETGHLNDIIFGASEFTTGIQFRFTKNDDKGKNGCTRRHAKIRNCDRRQYRSLKPDHRTDKGVDEHQQAELLPVGTET